MSNALSRGTARLAVVIGIVLAVLAGAGAVVIGRYFRPTPIERIQQQPYNYDGRIVTVVGTVRRSMSVLGFGAMTVDDGTGSIWVVVRGGVPRPGTRIRVRGRVHAVLQIGNLSVVGIDAR